MICCIKKSIIFGQVHWNKQKKNKYGKLRNFKIFTFGMAFCGVTKGMAGLDALCN